MSVEIFFIKLDLLQKSIRSKAHTKINFGTYKKELLSNLIFRFSYKRVQLKIRVYSYRSIYKEHNKIGLAFF